MISSLTARYAGCLSRMGASSARRGFAAAVEEVATPKAPGTAGRYAMALYTAAQKNGSLDAVNADVNSMLEMQASTPVLDSFMRNPTLPRSAKVSTLGDVSAKAGFSPIFQNFLMVVAENGRSSEAEKILKTFAEMIASTKGEVVLRVTSVEPLSAWELALLKKNIQERFYGEKPMEFTVETATDESLMGGFTVQIGDRFMDLSTRTELRKLTDIIGGAVQ